MLDRMEEAQRPTPPLPRRHTKEWWDRFCGMCGQDKEKIPFGSGCHCGRKSSRTEEVLKQELELGVKLF